MTCSDETYGTFFLEAAEMYLVKRIFLWKHQTSGRIESHTSFSFCFVYFLTIIRNNIYKQTKSHVYKITGEF